MEVEEKGWEATEVSSSHVPFIPANPVALEQPPSGPLDDGSARAAAYGSIHGNIQHEADAGTHLRSSVTER